MGPVGEGKVVVSATGVGSALPTDCDTTAATPLIWVSGSWPGSCDGMNSTTLPDTRTRLPTLAAPRNPALVVNTNRPCDVAGFASASLSGLCT